MTYEQAINKINNELDAKMGYYYYKGDGEWKAERFLIAVNDGGNDYGLYVALRPLHIPLSSIQ